MGKQYDWELEKFRLGKKGIDKGNKKRGIKNLARFIKNPIGYIGWKTHRWTFPTPKLLVYGGIAYFFGVLYYWKTISNEYVELDTVLANYGKNVEGTSGRMKGYHSRKPFHQVNMIEGPMRSHFVPDLVTVNPTWKQNIRKELQLTNNHNVVF
jgi:hypothetical protein